MKHALTLAALLASAPAMGQHYGKCISYDYKQDHWAECTQQDEEAAALHRLNQIPAHLLVIPQAWSTDQGDPEIACYHYDKGPYRDRLIEWCLAQVRGEK